MHHIIDAFFTSQNSREIFARLFLQKSLYTLTSEQLLAIDFSLFYGEYYCFIWLYSILC